MKSMTGFSYLEVDLERFLICLTLKSYNSKTKDIKILLPEELEHLENDIKKYLKEKIKRGKLEFKLSFKRKELFNEIDFKIMDKCFEFLTQIQNKYNFENMDVNTLLRLYFGEHNIKKTTRDDFNVDEIILKSMDKLVEDFDKERLREGEELKRDIMLNIEKIKHEVQNIEKEKLGYEEVLLEQIKNKIKVLVNEDINEDRLYTELGILIIKHSINEEMVRLSSHVKEIERIIINENDVKTIEFLCQEANRESNTIASKSFLLSVINSTIAIKDSVENVREQVKNVE